MQLQPAVMDELATLFDNVQRLTDTRNAIRAVIETYIGGAVSSKSIQYAIRRETERRARLRGMTTAVTPIVAEVCAAHGRDIGDVLGQSKEQHFARVRFECYWRLRKDGYSLKSIGRVMGGRGHHAIMHGLRVFNERIKNEPDLRRRLGIPDPVVQ